MDLFYTEIQKIVTGYCGEYLPYRVRVNWCKLVLAVLVSGSVVLNRLSGVQAHSPGHQELESCERQVLALAFVTWVVLVLGSSPESWEAEYL